MSDPNIEILRKESLLKLIVNSIDTRLFNTLLVRLKNPGGTKDILEDGEYSCAYFVSSLLYLTELIDKPRATVKSTESYLKKYAEEIKLEDAKLGDIVVWEKKTFPNGNKHAHIGFLMDPEEAVSTDYEKKKVCRHAIDDKGRVVSAVYRLVDKK